MDAILHLGTEKTGSTAIQRFLSFNREALIKQGFYFMQSTGLNDDRRLSAYCLPEGEFDDFHKKNNIITEEDKKHFEQNLERSFKEELDLIPNNVKFVIFSSEHFHSRVKNKSQREKLKKLLDIGFSNVTLLTYLRSQLEVAVSHYSTYLKSGGIKSIEEYLEDCRPAKYYYDYWQFINGWEESFPKSTFLVKLYDRKELIGGDVVSDFCSAVGLELKHLKLLANTNESITPTGQELLKIVNKTFTINIESNARNSKRTAFAKIISQIFVGAGQRPRVEHARHIHQQFYLINEKVREKWFANREQLFNINFDNYLCEQKVNFELVEHFEKFIQMYNQFSPAQLAGISPELIDNLRDCAIYLERLGNSSTALSLMKIAHLLRPRGELIINKLEEYECFEKVKKSLALPRQQADRLNLTNSKLFESRSKPVGLIHTFDAKNSSTISVEFNFYPSSGRCVLSSNCFQKWRDKKGKIKPRASMAMLYLYDLIENRINSESFFWRHLVQNKIKIGTKLRVALDFGDGIKNDELSLCYDAEKNFNLAKLIPDIKFYENKAFSRLRKLVIQNSLDNWPTKESKAFWRGTTTGNFGWKFSTENISLLPRYKLCCIAGKNNKILDAKISNVTKSLDDQSRNAIMEKLKKDDVYGKYTNFIEFAKYKYLVEIDGNVTPWSFLQKLMLGSCVLRVESNRKQWFYDELGKWIHYVPVKADMSDLVDKIQWCLENDEKANEIALNGQRFADALSFDSQMNFAAEQLLSAAKVIHVPDYQVSSTDPYHQS